MGQVFTIPPHVPFLRALATGLLERGDQLADVTVLVPTRRAARALVEEFLAQAPTDALLLPAIRPLGDVDEEMGLEGAAPAGGDAGEAPLSLPPAIAPMHRRLALAQIIRAHGDTIGRPIASAAQAIALADDLGALLDTFAAQDVDITRLRDAVHGDYADHWTETLRFLEVITDSWPNMLASLGLTDPSARRAALIQATCRRWRDAPPGPIVAAGSTGSLKATADMLATIAKLDEGMVVLPGLDTGMEARAWDALEPAHPQFGLRLLLSRMGLERDDVALWPAAGTDDDTAAAARTRLVSEALRPAETTDAWRDAGAHLGDVADAALDGLTMVSADSPQLESLAIALALRSALETPGRTAALVTPDRNLARRVAADLARWDIAVDDSGGQPLAHTRTGSFLLLVAEMLAAQCAPVPLLAALKHPLAQGGQAQGLLHRDVEFLDKRVLRGPRPAPGLSGLADAIAAAATRAHGRLHEKDHARARTIHARLETLLTGAGDIADTAPQPAARLIETHIAICEALAATDTLPGAQALWSGTSGEAGAQFIADLLENAILLGDVPLSDYPAILQALMKNRMVRPKRRSHARLQILGNLEARLQQADLLVLGGLNEGVWPQRAETGAWINRPMRAQLGLEAPERLIGLAAHDVAQGLGTREVILTRAERADGQPTVPSRWWLRLENLVSGLGKMIDSGPWLALARAYDRPVVEARQIERPTPRPPVDKRPTRLSVTRINDLFRDPYAIYAGHVLKLDELDALEADAGARERGDIIHGILERFSRDYPVTQDTPMPDNAYARLVAIGEEMFTAAATRPAVRAIWWPRFLQVAEWFVPWETARRARILKTFVELKGELSLPLLTRDFTLSGIADRIDLFTDGTLAILDYKTGSAPTAKQTDAKFSVQLPLEAAMAARGAFENQKDGTTGPVAAKTSELAYVELKGGREPGKVVSATGKDKDAMTTGEDALEHTRALLTLFEDEETPYISRPRPQFLSYDGPFDHLARVKEWQTVSDTE